MTNNQLDMSFLGGLAERAQHEATHGQEFMLSDVHNQSRQAYGKFPEDPVIRQFAFVIERMAEKASPSSLISQRDMSDIYNNFARAQQDSKFRVVLGHFIGAEVVNVVTDNDYVKMNRTDADRSGITNTDLVDENLVNILSAALGDESQAFKSFDTAAANLGIKYVEAELTSLGLNSASVAVLGGNQDTLVYSAKFDSEKGQVTVAIPIDISGGKLLLPSTFIADDKIAELTATNIGYFIDKKAFIGDLTTPDVNEVLKAVGIISGNKSTVADASFNDQVGDLFSSSEGDIALSTANLFTNREYEDPKTYIDTTEIVEMPKELAHLSADFENSVLEAVSSYGRDAVDTGKRLLAMELDTFGFANTQVRYGSEDDMAITYIARVNTPRGPVEITVPIEMHEVSEGKFLPLAPAKFAHVSGESEFSSDSLHSFALGVSAAAPVSDNAFGFMTLPDLKGGVLQAIERGDYHMCESILNHISSRFDESDYNNALADYQNALIINAQRGSELKRTASLTSSGSTISAGKGSIYPRAPNGRLLKDVEYRDNQFSTQRALESRELNPLEEGGAAISTSKIILT